MPHITTATSSPERRTSWIGRIAHRLAELFAPDDEPVTASLQPDGPAALDAGGDEPTGPILRLIEAEPDQAEEDAFRWRRHPLLRSQPSSTLPMDEREARHEAVRGLFAARAGAFSCAEEHFAEAARCEAIDLTAIPGFWNLERRAMVAAVNAYEAAGRIRDASALNARIRSMYRPRALSPVPENVTQLQPADEKASRRI